MILLRAIAIALLASAVISDAAAAPLSLEQAIAKALENNPDARIARHRVAVAESGLDQANGAFWPTLQLQSSYTRTDHPVAVFGAALTQQSFDSSLDFNNVPDADDLNVRGVLTLPLYTGGGNSAQKDAAASGSAASRHDEQAARNELAFQVVRSFHTVAKARRFIEAAEAAVHSFQVDADLAKVRSESGIALKTEPLDFGVRLSQAREDLIRARNAHAIALRVLQNLVGDGSDIEIEEPTVAPPIPESQTPNGRPELQAASARIDAADSAVDIARSARRPQLSAFGSVDYDRGWRFDGSGTSYTAGVLLNWTLWDRRRTSGKIDEAESNHDISVEMERRTRLAIELEIETARLNLDAAEQRLDSTGKAVALADESAALTRERYEQGASLASQVIDAETALLAAKVRRAEAEADRQIAIAALRKALGLPQLDTLSTGK